MKKVFSFLFTGMLFGSAVCTGSVRLTPKPHEQWWEHNLHGVMNNVFAQWLGDVDAPSRVRMRNYIKSRGYKSILDVPSGLCTEFFGYQKYNVDIAYYGVDITQKLVDRALGLGINVVRGSIEEIPFADSSIEVVYARHILEHLNYYELAVNDLIRVAEKEAIIIFFIKPHARPDSIRPTTDKGHLLYHNVYNRKKLESFVRANPKVASIAWEDITSSENALHIYLK